MSVINETYQQLRSGVPERSAGGLTFAADAKSVAEFVAALPRANTAATSNALLHALEALLTQQPKGSVYCEVLARLSSAVADVVAALEQQLGAATFPLGPARAESAQQLGRFHRLLAQNYRAAVVSWCAPAGKPPMFKAAEVASCLHRAQFFTARQLLLAYMLYRAPEPGVWSAVHAVAAYGDAINVSAKRFEEPVGHQTTSVEVLYKAALIFALSNPYRFDPKAQSELWSLATDFASAAKLAASAPGGSSFVIAQREDGAPGFLGTSGDTDGTAALYLDLEPLRQRVFDTIKPGMEGVVPLATPDGKRLHVPAELTLRAAAAWSPSVARGYERLSATHRLQAVSGIATVHRALAGDRPLEVLARAAGLDAEPTAAENPIFSRALSDDSVASQSWETEVLDQSLGGYRLQWTQSQSARTRVGELVALAFPGGDAGSDGSQWMVGVLRWLRYETDGLVQAGVELVSRYAAPAVVLDGQARGRRAVAIERLNGDGSAVIVRAPTADAQARFRVSLAPSSALQTWPADVLAVATSLATDRFGDYVLLEAAAA